MLSSAGLTSRTQSQIEAGRESVPVAAKNRVSHPDNAVSATNYSPEKSFWIYRTNEMNRTHFCTPWGITAVLEGITTWRHTSLGMCFPWRIRKLPLALLGRPPELVGHSSWSIIRPWKQCPVRLHHQRDGGLRDLRKLASFWKILTACTDGSLTTCSSDLWVSQ